MINDNFHIYDTTLRDGAQQEGLNLTVHDKLAIARHLDELGVGFIEGGWPGANPMDTEFFKRAQTELKLKNATFVAFGATRRPNVKAADDQLLQALAESGATISLGDPIYPAILPFVFGEGWDKLKSEMSLPRAILEIGPHFSDALPKLLSSMVIGPNTLCHGDFRADNLLFNENDEPVVIDFQLLGSGTGAYDIAYFVTQSLTPEIASKYEQQLFDQWVKALIAYGAPKDLVDRDALWKHYRTAALFCLAYPVIASRGMDLSDPRQHKLIEVMTDRFDRAVRELNLAELL